MHTNMNIHVAGTLHGLIRALVIVQVIACVRAVFVLLLQTETKANCFEACRCIALCLNSCSFCLIKNFSII